MSHWLDELLLGDLRPLEAAARRRHLRTSAEAQGPVITIEGRRLVNFSSNDYLGLASDPRVIEAAVRATRQWGWGTGASPLVSGHQQPHRDLCRRLAEFKQTDAAVLFSTGYMANVGTICALVGRGDTVVADRLCHASIIDGCRLSGARFRVYPHNDMARLRRVLDRESGARRRLIVTDSVFSMDGDLAPLDALADLADRSRAVLMVDEAHATGVFGPQGRGVAELLGVEHRIPVRMGTLSKALGSLGGFVCGSQALADTLVNRARSFIYSTSPPASVWAGALAALDIVRDEPERRTRLLDSARDLRDRLAGLGFDCSGSAGPIIPILIGDDRAAVDHERRLLDAGLFVPCIRPPTVPPGTARLRISLSASHTPAHLAHLTAVLGQTRR